MGNAESIFADFLSRRKAGEEVDFEALCTEHQFQAEALRCLQADWQQVRAGRESIADIPEDAEDSVYTSGESFEDAAWQRFTEQLKSRGPAHSRYIFKGEVARGGMGVVHRVYDQDFRRHLAMKIILGRGPTKQTGDTPDVDTRSLGRFLEEAQVTGQLDHPGIVPAHELGVDEGDNVYFTMKLVKGEDLRSVFDRVHDPNDDGWNQTRALSLMLRVCEAMAYAHSKGVIHRDLKPANIMVGKYGETYVMDWGLAKVVGQNDHNDIGTDLAAVGIDAALVTSDSPLVTMDGDVVGTPAYMSPEQAAGRLEEVGPRSDIYAAGAMLYHLLTDRMPYTESGVRATPSSILKLAQAGPPKSLLQLVPDVSPELTSICEKAMERDVKARYRDMDGLADDLRAYLEQRVVAAHESGAIAELKMWVRRNKGIATTVAAALVSVLALSGWALVEKERADTNAIASDRNAGLAVQRAEDATARKAEFDQLAGVVMLEDALALEGKLYPAVPKNIAAMKEWLAKDAAELLALKPTLAQTLSDLEGRVSPPTDEERQRDRTTHARFSELEALPEQSPERAALEAEVSRRRTYRFSTESERFLYTTLSSIAANIATFEESEMRQVEQRLAWARRLDELTHSHPNAKVSWEEARDAILAADGVLSSELYRDPAIDLTPQLGLVPIGMNPVTLLWEFYDLRTAFDLGSGRDPAEIVIPEHAEDGTLAIGDETGVVFVLIPGGRFWMGAQKDDAYRPNYDPQAAFDESPVHEVTLDAYFLSRYELTQGQWKRIAGDNPSFYGPDGRWGNEFDADQLDADFTHPVDHVRWDDCMFHLGRVGMTLPTEAQWEYACRAGTSTPWWTGSELMELDAAGNLADQYGKMNGNDAWPSWEADLDDGNSVHARVGRYEANRFGLHDTIGNMWEWCLDGYEGYGTPGGRTGDGARALQSASYRICRGGSFYALASYARSARRSGNAPAYASQNLGCRSARGLLTE